MSRAPKILGISGSLRSGSLNTAFLKSALAYAESQGAEVELLDLKALDLPLYDQDLEDAGGLPEGCITLKDKLKAFDGVLYACPEYNSAISAALKNAIDWASRPREGEKPLECFAGKTAGLIACSPGALGGLRGLVSVRMLLGNIAVLVSPKQYAAGGFSIDENGHPADEQHTRGAQSVVDSLLALTRSQIGG